MRGGLVACLFTSLPRTDLPPPLPPPHWIRYNRTFYASIHVFVLGLMQFVSILQHCTLDFGSYTKDLTIVNEDLSSVFILDNSPGAYQYNPGKAVGT